MMEIKGENYIVWYDTNTAVVNFTGVLRLNGMQDYAPILRMLNEVAKKESFSITLNLQQLKFLNSSGIGMLSNFVIYIREKNTIPMTILASNAIPWQRKSLKNFQRLMPDLTIELVE
jgi:hypothetical protein